MSITSKALIAAILIVVGISSAYAGGLLTLHVGSADGNGGAGATNFLLADTGSAILVNTGSKMLVQ